MLKNILSTGLYDLYRSTSRFQLINQIKYFSNVPERIPGYDDFMSKYSKKQQTLILKTLNKGKEKDLKKLEVSESYFQILNSYLQKNGPFKTLNDVAALNETTLSQLDNLCKSIIELKETKPKSLTSSEMSKEKKENLKTFVAVRIRKTYISWICVDRNGCILDWSCDTFEDLPLNADLLKIIQIAKKLQSKIPNADAYVMEKSSSKPSSSMSGTLHRVFSRQEQIVSLVVNLLLVRQKNINEVSDAELVEDFYLMRSQAPANLFNLRIGGEIVNSHSTVSSILESKTVKLKKLTHISIDDKIINGFKTADLLKQDELGHVLLLSLTFLNSIVL